LYDEYSDELHEFIRRYLLLFDEATADRVLFVFVGNPEESGPVYRGLRDVVLKGKDDADAKAYQAKLKTVGADYLRRDEVRSLRQGLEVSGEDLPCIVFFTGRARGARALLRIHQEWIADAAAQRQLARALVGFFRSEEFEKLLGTWMTKTERIQKFGTLINDHMARCLHTVGRQETPSRTILMLTEIKGGEDNRGLLARIVGADRFDVVSKEIGPRELFFISLLFDSKRTLEMAGKTLTVVPEDQVVEAFKEWSQEGRLQFKGMDQAHPTHRVQKNWREFVRQIEKESCLKGLFTTVKNESGQKLFALRLRLDETANRIPSISALFPRKMAS
jgi:hypothetical protein